MQFGFGIRIDDVMLRTIIEKTPERADDFVEATARAGQAHVMEAFGSDGSPSTVGGVPGIDTGTLKNSIMVEPHGQLSRSIVVGGGVEYGLHLEFGTKRMGARPFMLPMAVWLADQVEDIWRGFIQP